MASIHIADIIKSKLQERFKVGQKTSQPLAQKFSAYISILVFATAIFITTYSFTAEAPILRENTLIKIENAKHIAQEFYTAYTQNLAPEKIQHLIQKTIQSHTLLKFIIIVDHKGKCTYTSLSNFAGQSITHHNFINTSLFQKTLRTKRVINPDHLYLLTVKTASHDKIYLGYDLLSYKKLMQQLYFKKVILAVIFVIFGFITAKILSNMVTKPLAVLSEKVEKLSSGNFNVDIIVNSSDEVGKLSKAFSLMAKNLNDLYSQLEEKVNERTLALNNKNLELENAYKELKNAQAQLVQQEKMSSLGLLVAGVAHELNNPINFIHGNIDHLKIYVHDLLDLINKYENLEQFLPEDLKFRIHTLKNEIDYVFLKCDIEELLSSCKEGSERSKQIISDLRNFSRLDEAIIKEVNINEGLDSTLNILKSEYKDRIIIHKDYSSLPLFNCYAGQLNQVFMNLLSNAIHAIPEKGDIFIATLQNDKNIEIKIRDTGTGIAPEHLNKIFDPFYTTKDTGQGTGLGLAISYNIIQNHCGIIDVESTINEGSTFTIKIPMDWYKNINEKN